MNVVNWVNCTTIAANLATVIGVIGVAITVLVFFKNKVTKKTIQIKVTALTASFPRAENNRINLEIDLYNFTNRQFFITVIEFVINDQHVIFSELYQPYQNAFYETRHIKNIGVLPHEAKTISGFIEVSAKTKLPAQLTVLINTTEKNLSFRVPVRKAKYFDE